MTKKLLYILSHPIQYQSPLLKKIAGQKEIKLKVLYLTDHTIGGFDKQFGSKIKWDTPLFDGYEYEFVKNNSLKPAVSGSFFGLVNFNIIKKIRKEKPDIIIIHGWAYFTNWFIFIFSFFFKAKIWMRAESPLNQELKKLKLILCLKKFVFKFFLIKIIDRFLYIGKQNKEFYKYYGVTENKLIFAPYSVDNERFSKTYDEYKNNISDIKKVLGLPSDNKFVLSAGKYMPKKRTLDILEAFRLQNKENITLILLGEGLLRTELEQKIKTENIKNVILTGFINQSEISKYYAVADVFVLASTIGETWGLVVNEAMNFGLPIITSDMPGSAFDLVENGKNGFVFETGNIEALRKHLKFVLENEEFVRNAKTISLNKIKKFSYDVMVKNIVADLTLKHENENNNSR
ncbi:MAG: glycosyltransferase family 4 protein [Bacteroidales bacterium]|nr:glycosyltransferase family 4 protein [Bacteroidales bacterium]